MIKRYKISTNRTYVILHDVILFFDNSDTKLYNFSLAWEGKNEYILYCPISKSAVGPPNQGRAQAPYSVLSFCLLGKK